MAEQVPALDPSVRAALEKLADIAAPPPVSFLPQTWGWVALGLMVLALIAFGLWCWWRHREANRYRVEALAELAAIERSIADDSLRPAALPAIGTLLKRVSLAAWPRSRVASLACGRWIDFLNAAGRGAELGPALKKLLNDIKYRPAADIAAVSADEARLCTMAAKRWIEAHRVSA